MDLENLPPEVRARALERGILIEQQPFNDPYASLRMTPQQRPGTLDKILGGIGLAGGIAGSLPFGQPRLPSRYPMDEYPVNTLPFPI
jgi:hypothetical protein